MPGNLVRELLGATADGTGSPTGTGSATGELLATSSELPTAAKAANAAFTSSDFTFTAAPGLAAHPHLSVDGATFRIARFDASGTAIASVYPAAVDGFWIVAKVGGDEVDRYKIHRDQEIPGVEIDFAKARNGQVITDAGINLILDEIATSAGVFENIRFTGRNHGLASQGTIEIYFSLAGGSTGPRGARGLTGDAQDAIYRRSSTNTAPPTPTGGLTDAAYTPSGWTRSPASLSDSMPFLWVSRRTGSGNAWAAFSAPSVLGHYSGGSVAWSSLTGFLNLDSLDFDHVQDADTFPIYDESGAVLARMSFGELVSLTVDRINDLTGDDRLSYNALRDTPAPGGGGDITGVTAGTGLSGGGTTGDVTLNVENPFTTTEKTKLGGVEMGATADQTGAEIVALLEALTAGNRLSYTRLDDTPTIPAQDGVVNGGSYASGTLTLTRTVGGNIVITGLPTGGSTPPPALPTHQRYFYWSATVTAPTATQVQGGVSDTTGMATLNTSPDDGAFYHFYIWSAMPLTSIMQSTAFNPTDNLFDTFTESRLQIGATNGYLYTRQIRGRLIGTAATPSVWTTS